MTEVKSIPFNTLLKIVAIVDGKNAEFLWLLRSIASEGYEIEITASYERDAFEDALRATGFIYSEALLVRPNNNFQQSHFTA